MKVRECVWTPDACITWTVTSALERPQIRRHYDALVVIGTVVVASPILRSRLKEKPLAAGFEPLPFTASLPLSLSIYI